MAMALLDRQAQPTWPWPWLNLRRLDTSAAPRLCEWEWHPLGASEANPVGIAASPQDALRCLITASRHAPGWGRIVELTFRYDNHGEYRRGRELARWAR